MVARNRGHHRVFMNGRHVKCEVKGERLRVGLRAYRNGPTNKLMKNVTLRKFTYGVHMHHVIGFTGNISRRDVLWSKIAFWIEFRST